jgi:hypothetical protein
MGDEKEMILDAGYWMLDAGWDFALVFFVINYFVIGT